jgi:voltage-gated potassium channel
MTDPDPSAARLERWERRTRLPIVLAAVLPIVTLLGPTEDGARLALDLVTWAVFVADLVVHVWLRRGYLRSRWGLFDVVVVLLTFPWYVFPGISGSDVLVLARLARLGRVLAMGVKGDLLVFLQRMGRSGLVAGSLCVFAAVVVRAVEPRSSGFADLGDGLWWAMVTLTTVGYGDLFPVTTAGRIVAVLLMFGGLALLGTIAGSLAALFEKEDADDDAEQAADERAAHEAAQDDAQAQLAALRAEVRSLHDKLDRLTGST